MKKQLKNVLHFYLGRKCMIRWPDAEWKISGIDLKLLAAVYDRQPLEVKPVLRRLETLTKEESLHLAWLNLDSEKYLSKDSRISKEEIDIDIHPNDGGNMVDGNVAVVIDVSCRCAVLQLVVMLDGSLQMWDTDKDQRTETFRQPEQFAYLIELGFDVFGLIEAGLAIDESPKEE